MSTGDAIGAVVALVLTGVPVGIVVVMIRRAVRIYLAGRRSERARSEIMRLRESGQINAFEAVCRLNEAHARFQREAYP